MSDRCSKCHRCDSCGDRNNYCDDCDACFEGCEESHSCSCGNSDCSMCEACSECMNNDCPNGNHADRHNPCEMCSNNGNAKCIECCSEHREATEKDSSCKIPCVECGKCCYWLDSQGSRTCECSVDMCDCPCGCGKTFDYCSCKVRKPLNATTTISVASDDELKVGDRVHFSGVTRCRDHIGTLVYIPDDKTKWYNVQCDCGAGMLHRWGVATSTVKTWVVNRGGLRRVNSPQDDVAAAVAAAVAAVKDEEAA